MYSSFFLGHMGIGERFWLCGSYSRDEAREIFNKVASTLNTTCTAVNEITNELMIEIIKEKFKSADEAPEGPDYLPSKSDDFYVVETYKNRVYWTWANNSFKVRTEVVRLADKNDSTRCLKLISQPWVRDFFMDKYPHITKLEQDREADVEAAYELENATPKPTFDVGDLVEVQYFEWEHGDCIVAQVAADRSTWSDFLYWLVPQDNADKYWEAPIGPIRESDLIEADNERD